MYCENGQRQYKISFPRVVINNDIYLLFFSRILEIMTGQRIDGRRNCQRNEMCGEKVSFDAEKQRRWPDYKCLDVTLTDCE